MPLREITRLPQFAPLGRHEKTVVVANMTDLLLGTSMPPLRPAQPYAEAAKKYAPERTGVLFVAEAPPNRIDRYFYFEDVKQGDWLWIALMKALFPWDWGSTETERQGKKYWLQTFQKNNFRLIDAVKTPIGGTHGQRARLIRAAASELIKEIQSIDPKHIVLIKTTVHEGLFQRLREAGLPVVNKEPLPFPSSGRQKQFQDGFRRLVDSGALRILPLQQKPGFGFQKRDTFSTST